MEERDETIEQEEEILSEPSRELAEKVTRKVAWKDRIEGYTYIRGPGEMWEYHCKLQEVYNVLSAMPNFRIDNGTLKRWVGKTLGDEELAEKIGKAQSENSGDVRQRVVTLLGIRLKQCDTVLEEREEEQMQSAFS